MSTNLRNSRLELGSRSRILVLVGTLHTGQAWSSLGFPSESDTLCFDKLNFQRKPMVLALDARLDIVRTALSFHIFTPNGLCYHHPRFLSLYLRFGRTATPFTFPPTLGLASYHSNGRCRWEMPRRQCRILLFMNNGGHEGVRIQDLRYRCQHDAMVLYIQNIKAFMHSAEEALS
ncbi:uncharacterized protein BJ212DRAFT_23362 [Suillus subaureus]|uniref:Uncharacterized protein n=1 Tax=Suillus subaureus TaxID=48587 RepID=A0A9P7JJP9_9AGAM|nr:uncharacterized protein BJ212DRAFT_23362 [Suillus subaureus]KAG1826989.1 hypothetical protein BJ212DRAFT_23362 [Suillus subaureus]